MAKILTDRSENAINHTQPGAQFRSALIVADDQAIVRIAAIGSYPAVSIHYPSTTAPGILAHD